MSRLGIVGVPLDLGGGRRGVDMGPSAVRIAGIGERLAALGHEVHDYGDVDTPTQETTPPGDPRQRYLGEIARVCQASRGRFETSSKAVNPRIIIRRCFGVRLSRDETSGPLTNPARQIAAAQVIE